MMPVRRSGQERAECGLKAVFSRKKGARAERTGAATNLSFKGFLLHPRKWRTRAPVFNRGFGGGARGCGFEERVGVYARTGGIQFPMASLLCLCVCLSQNGSLLLIRWSSPFKKPDQTPRRLGAFATRGAMPCLSTDLTNRAVPHFIQALKMGRRTAPKALSDFAHGCGDERVNRDAVRGFGQ